eukprot:c19701_g1_i5.p1 GENE.c19701_g1_i5~~c19701_g1_i5.p1  ORF type:complete len:641 (+),score=173.19 c19701_g1_i5:53-1975(+)
MEPFALSQHIERNLFDKAIEKRKIGACDLEVEVQDLQTRGLTSRILEIVRRLTNLTESPSTHVRKGSMLGLAAIIVSLKQDCGHVLADTLHPVVRGIADSDPRVQYHACEALYNMINSAKNQIMPYFKDIFHALFTLSLDVNLDTKRALILVDDLLKQLAFQFPELIDIQGLVVDLNSRIDADSLTARLFVVGWVQALEKISAANILIFIPQLLEGMMRRLCESDRELRQIAYVTIAAMLEHVKAAPRRFDFVKAIQILTPQCSSENVFVRLTTFKWLSEFAILSPALLFNFIAQILEGALQGLSGAQDEVASLSGELNSSLMSLLRTQDAPLANVSNILTVVAQNIPSPHTATRLASLHWLNLLIQRVPNAVGQSIGEIFPKLLPTLTDSNDSIVAAGLQALSLLSATPSHFDLALEALISSFRENGSIAKRNGLIVRKLCTQLGSETVFVRVAQLLQRDKDVKFVSNVVNQLSLILIVAPELESLRDSIKNIKSNPESQRIFVELFECWSRNAVASLTLCFLAGEYQLASEIVIVISQQQIDRDTISQLDKLVHLLESPAFVSLRVQMLEQLHHPHLTKALYGILMIIPQSLAFTTLSCRLKGVPQSRGLTPSSAEKSGVKVLELLRLFTNVQSTIEA